MPAEKCALARFLSYRRIRRHTVPPPKAAMEAREFIRVRFTSLDLRTRFYERIEVLPYRQIQNISDAAQGIFDYYPF